MVQYLKSRADASSNSSTSVSALDVSAIVKSVIDDIRTSGDKAVRSYSEKFDKWSPPSFRLSAVEIEKIIAEVPEQTIKDIKEVQSNVRTFAEAQRDSLKDFEVEIRKGVKLGQKNLPIGTVGT